jgi:DNA-dependent RNA polymerase auxiliary subunit epsilon
MQEAEDLVVSKQDDQGRWKLESTFNGRFITDIEQKNMDYPKRSQGIKRFYS